MSRKVLKFVLACLTNLFGLLVVHAVIGPRHLPGYYEGRVLRAADAPDSWRSAQAAMVSPGRVEGSNAYEHTMSPFGLRALIREHPYTTDLAPLWSWFRVESVLASDCAPCDAEVFQLELDSERGVETVLRIGSGKTRYQYLVFKHVPLWLDPTGWKFLGLIDDITSRYDAPPHFTSPVGSKHLFVVRTQEPFAAEIVSYHNRVFEVGGDGVREVLSYPTSGYQLADTDAPERDFDALLLESRSAQEGDTLRVQYTGYHFHVGGRTTPRQRMVVFTRPKGSGRFVLDLRHSDISPAEFPSVFETDAATSEEFLRLNFEVLARVAAGTDEAEREWLRGVVRRHHDTPRAVSLARLLRR